MDQTKYVRVGDLKFDPEYQRIDGIKHSRVNDIAKNFDPLIVGVITVSQRADGSLWVVDGMHRVLGCQIRFGDDYQMIAVVHVGLNSFDEARMFWKQTNRTGISKFHQHRARVASNDATAIAISSILSEFGVMISQNRGNTRAIRAVSTVEEIYKTDGAANLRETLSIMQGADLLRGENGVNGLVIRAVSAAVAIYGEVWNRERTIRKLREMDQLTIRRELLATYKSMGSGNKHRKAQAIANIYNSGLQERNRLPPASEIGRGRK